MNSDQFFSFKMNLVFWILFFCFSHFTLTIGMNVPCDGNGHRGIWTCLKDNDSNTVNVTYDCKLNNEEDTSIWLWSAKFPNNIETLTIQNCRILYLYTESLNEHHYSIYKRVKDPMNIKFRSLKLENISRFQSHGYFSGWNNYVYFKQYDYDSIWKSPECSLREVIFENISTARFDSSEFIPDCPIKVVKLLRLNNFKIENTFPEINNCSFEITSSKFNGTDTSGYGFLVKNASQVIVSNNNITSLFILSLEASQVIISNNYIASSSPLTLRAENILMFGNKMEYLGERALEFKGKNVQITNNIFHHIHRRALQDITTVISSPKNNITRTYNFSNNIIYSLMADSLVIERQDVGQRNYFDELIIFNNSINCDCVNTYWFRSVFPQDDPHEKRFYKKWLNDTNQNKCLNIPKCPISRVLNNYNELCENDHDCPKFADIKTRNYSTESSVNLNRFNYEISRNISDLLQILVDKVGKIPIKDIDDERHVRRLNSMDSHLLVIIIILFCFLLIYIAVIICFKSSLMRILTLKFVSKPKPLYNETEMS